MAFIQRPQSFTLGWCGLPPEGGDQSNSKVPDYAHITYHYIGLQRCNVSKTLQILCRLTCSCKNTHDSLHLLWRESRFKKQMQMRHLFNTWLSIMWSINEMSVLYMTSQGTFLSLVMSCTPTAECFSRHFLKVAPMNRGKGWKGKRHRVVWKLHFLSLNSRFHPLVSWDKHVSPLGKSSHVRPQVPLRCIVVIQLYDMFSIEPCVIFVGHQKQARHHSSVLCLLKEKWGDGGGGDGAGGWGGGV